MFSFSFPFISLLLHVLSSRIFDFMSINIGHLVKYIIFIYIKKVLNVFCVAYSFMYYSCTGKTFSFVNIFSFS